MPPIILDYTKEESLRGKILLFLLGMVVPIHARLYSKRQPWNLRREDLIQYPEGSLGKEIGLFLHRENLQPIPKIERHDAFHILFDFSTHIYDESAIQFFLWGNGKTSFFTVVSASFSGLLLPERMNYFITQFRNGKKFRCIAKWDFKELLFDDFIDLKKIVRHQQVHNPELLKKLAAFEA